MHYLILVTVLWAFSFSLIGELLAPSVDAYVAVFIRMLLAFLLLAPMLRLSQHTRKLQWQLMAIGAVQIGIMYLLLYHAFLYISVAEVLLFTIFTPLYITLIDEWLLNRKPLPKRWWLAAGLSVVGAGIIRYQGVSTEFLTGFLLIQGANLCFALGQVAYKRIAPNHTTTQIQHYALFFLGALFISGLAMLLFGNMSRLPTTATHWAVLVWLGLGASGAGYLVWSLASKKVNIGQLATMNNALIPAGLLVNYLLWGQNVQWGSLLLGGSVILFAVWLCQPQKSTA
ncbi:EamA family transporter [Aliidiomarina celeris]|uniref:EamA family transporter n=1 Tax=Aliidiomarina celeris TaxID=2249428 RepID=UPI000DE91044|nr:EamA family transporter [Aliidiomarina celeris]